MTQPSPGPTVLVVDDDEVTRMLARRFLEADGFGVHEAGDGESALERIGERRPDAVLLDLEMPGIDGFEVCARLRADAATRDLPVVIFTAHGDLASIARAYRAGATDFSTKPVNWPVLAHRLRYLLRSAETVLDLARAQRLAALGSWSSDAHGEGMRFSDELYRLLGMDPAADPASWAALRAHVPQGDLARLEQARSDAIHGETCDVSHRLEADGAGERVVRHRIGPALLEAGRAVRLWGIVHDVTDLHRASERARRLAYYDALTGLPNRIAFQDHLQRAVARAGRHDQRLAVLTVHLDGLQRITDGLGTAAGDALVRGAAGRLRDVARACDFVCRVDGDFVDGELARLAGDEFAVALSDIRTDADAAAVAARIVTALSEPQPFEGQPLDPEPRIGIAVYPRDAHDADALLEHADAERTNGG